MSDLATSTASLFSAALNNISPGLMERQRIARQLLAETDPFERIAPTGLLAEATGRFLAEASRPLRPLTLLMDRLGGGEGAGASAALLGLLGDSWPWGSLVHVAFATPARGAGTLVRGNLKRVGAESKVVVDVVADNRPAEGLQLAQADAEQLVAGCSLVVTYAPGGIGGLLPPPSERGVDLLLSRSHVAVLSFPDPESLVADLKALEAIVDKEPGIDALRFWAEVETDGQFRALGHAVLGQGGDAHDRLWVLLDNARRRRYRFLVEPMWNGTPTGTPYLCPCQTAIEQGLLPELVIDRVVRAGNRLVVVGRGAEAPG
jgi:hypothetical protein